MQSDLLSLSTKCMQLSVGFIYPCSMSVNPDKVYKDKRHYKLVDGLYSKLWCNHNVAKLHFRDIDVLLIYSPFHRVVSLLVVLTVSYHFLKLALHILIHK